MKRGLTALLPIAIWLSAPLWSFAANSPWEANLLSNEIRLQLDEGIKVTAKRISGVDLGAGNFSWTGEVTGKVPGYVTLSFVYDSLSGSVNFPGKGCYELSKGSSGELVATQLVGGTSLPCGACSDRKAGSWKDPRRIRRSRTWRNGDGNVIDLLVVYTAGAMAMEGSGAADDVAAKVATAVADTNLCFRNSRVDVSLRLVHLKEVDYVGTANLWTDLDRLTEKEDGYLDDVHDLRDQYGADLVTLLVAEGNATVGGLANTMNYPSHGFEESAFNVMRIQQIAAPSYTLAHEIGHNMGCLHNREDAMNRGIPATDASNTSAFKAFNYGKRWEILLELDPDNPFGEIFQGYRTVMSYDVDDNDPIFAYSNTVPYFSNPDVSYLGETTGNTGTEDNAQVLRFTAPYVANFRTAVVQGIIPSLPSLTVREGNSNALQVRLAVQPATTVTVTASIASGGDSDLTIVPGYHAVWKETSILTFDAENWNLPQPVLLSAKPDTDSSAGSAILSLSASGMTTVTVSIVEIDTGTTAASGHLVAGIITNSLGKGISGATLNFSNSGGSATTDSNGTFRHSLPTGWSGILTPNKPGHTFTPASASISSLSSYSASKAFVATRSNVLYVNSSASGSGDGSSWEDAYADLADAFRSEHPFDEIWVAKGVYKPGIVRPASFHLPPGISVYGGFVGAETSREERNATANQTFLSGELGISNDGSDNAYHVVVPSDGSFLDGFIIRDGNASENFTDDRGQGGALWAEKVSFTISNCTIGLNDARQTGGAVFLNEANATFTNCSFYYNDSVGRGGSLYSKDSNLTITGCIFHTNTSEAKGGALAAVNSTLSLEGTTFTSNQSDSQGGATYFEEANATFTNCSFYYNDSVGRGGSLYSKDSNLTITGCLFYSSSSEGSGGALAAQNSNLSLEGTTFTSNQSDYQGGATYLEEANATITGCLFHTNTSETNGGALAAQNSNLSLAGITFISNQSDYQGGATYLEEANVTISECSFTSNAGNYSGGAISLESASPTISDCVFTRNVSEMNSGGALYVDANSSPTFARNEFQYNSSLNHGGAIYLAGSQLVEVSNGLFLGNSAKYGGAISAWGTKGLTFTNCRFFGNEANATADSEGGVALLDGGTTDTTFVNCAISGNSAINRSGIFTAEGGTRFVNCTLAANVAGDLGGITILFDGESVAFENCILWGNYAIGSGNDVYVNTGTATANNSIFDSAQSIGALTGSGNLSGNPLFTDANGPDNVYGTEDDDLTLQSGSPAVDAASSSATGYLTKDLLGKTRYGPAADLGPYEYRINSAPIFTQGSAATLAASVDTATSSTYSATDADADGLAWSVLSQSSNGSTSVNASTGATTYLPSANWSGSDSFVLQVSDGIATDEITVDVNVTASEVEEITSFTLTTSNEGQGEVTGDGIYAQDTNATLTATAASGYVFEEWGGDAYGATNVLTISMDANKSVTAIFAKQEESWTSANDEGYNWYSFSWFGEFHEIGNGWLYHREHGWLYRSGNITSTWLYDPQLGWLWTNAEIYPYLYYVKEATWLYYYETGTKVPRFFYHFSLQQWYEMME